MYLRDQKKDTKGWDWVTLLVKEKLKLQRDPVQLIAVNIFVYMKNKGNGTKAMVQRAFLRCRHCRKDDSRVQ